MKQLVVLAAVAISLPALAESPYAADKRVTMIAQALAAVGKMDGRKRTDLREFVHVTARNKCRGSSSSLRADCLIAAARRECGGDESCGRVADVLIMNKLSERSFISTRERYAILRDAKDARAAVERELSRRYAHLVTRFRLSAFYTEGAALAKSLDGYCLREASDSGLSWQYCVAAMTWFVGTAE